MELQIRITQLAREGSPLPGLRQPQAKFSRNSNQIARGRIRRFESYYPSQTVRLSALLRALIVPASWAPAIARPFAPVAAMVRIGLAAAANPASS